MNPPVPRPALKNVHKMRNFIMAFGPIGSLHFRYVEPVSSISLGLLWRLEYDCFMFRPTHSQTANKMRIFLELFKATTHLTVADTNYNLKDRLTLYISYENSTTPSVCDRIAIPSSSTSTSRPSGPAVIPDASIRTSLPGPSVEASPSSRAVESSSPSTTARSRRRRTSKIQFVRASSPAPSTSGVDCGNDTKDVSDDSSIRISGIPPSPVVPVPSTYGIPPPIVKLTQQHTSYAVNRLRDPRILDLVRLYIGFLRSQPTLCYRGDTSFSLELKLRAEGFDISKIDEIYEAYLTQYDIPIERASRDLQDLAASCHTALLKHEVSAKLFMRKYLGLQSSTSVTYPKGNYMFRTEKSGSCQRVEAACQGTLLPNIG